MTAINDWDRFEAHWQSLKELIDKTTDVDLLDTVAADLQRLVDHASERCTGLEDGTASAGTADETAPATPEAQPG